MVAWRQHSERLVFMNVRTTALVFATVSVTGIAALAQTTGGTTTVAGTPTHGIRRDPAGRTGISPAWEAIKRGDDAYIAHNLDGAIHEYQSAIESRPQDPVAHYRLACALIAKGELKAAQESLDAALRFSQSDPKIAAKVLFVTADLKERQQDYPAALAAWKAYSVFVGAHPAVRAFAASSESRQAKIAAFAKLTEQSTQVKQRIDERLQLTEPQVPKDAKSSKKTDTKSQQK